MKNSSVFTNKSSDFNNFSVIVAPMYPLEKVFLSYVIFKAVLFLSVLDDYKTIIFYCLRPNMVDLWVTMNEENLKSKKLCCLWNTYFDLCGVFPSLRFFEINLIKLNLDWKYFQHYKHSKRHLSSRCIQKAR